MNVLVGVAVLVVLVVICWRVVARWKGFAPMDEREQDIGQAVPPSGRPSTTQAGGGYRQPGTERVGSADDDWSNPHRRHSKWDV